MSAKFTVASLNAAVVNAFDKTEKRFEAVERMVAELRKELAAANERIEALEVSNLQLRTELLEVRATPKPKTQAAKPTEPRMEGDVYTFIPANCNVTAVATKSREAVKLDGNIVKCTPQVWAFWKTTLERQQKASARETSQYEEYCA